MHWHRKCRSIPNCKYHAGIPLDQARKQSKGLQPQRPAGPSHGYGRCCGPMVMSAAASPPLGHVLHWPGKCCQNSVRATAWKGWGVATAQTQPFLQSELFKCPDPAEDGLSSVDPTARAESTPFRQLWAYTKGWALAQTSRPVPETDAARQLP